MLPDGEWITLIPLCLSLNIPVIMTTAKFQLEDKLAAFELWAVDYLVKPFALEELAARIAIHCETKKKSDINRVWTWEISLQQRHITLIWNDIIDIDDIDDDNKEEIETELENKTEKNKTEKTKKKREKKKKENITLTWHERRFLEILLEVPWDIAKRTDILEKIWWDVWWHDSHLDVIVAKIRKKLWKETIETIKWIWYRLVVPWKDTVR